MNLYSSVPLKARFKQMSRDKAVIETSLVAAYFLSSRKISICGLIFKLELSRFKYGKSEN